MKHAYIAIKIYSTSQMVKLTNISKTNDWEI